MWSIVTFASGFFGMEIVAWAAHKYLMHGPLWSFHRDHHTPGRGFFQRNDYFFIVFALPSWLSIQLGVCYSLRPLTSFGFGVMAFGAAYVTVHEILIHRRFILFKMPTKGYLRAIVSRHQIHHQKRFKEDGRYFGMLWAPPREW